MTQQLRPVDISFLKAKFKAGELGDPGAKPRLDWLLISNLMIDASYQRNILDTGARNILAIASNFSWIKFGAVVVASLGTGVYAIVDGQHRATAALLCGVSSVPCLVVEASRQEQAAAFAAINDGVTRMSSLQIFNAKVEGRDKTALAVVDACKAAGVTLIRHKNHMQVLRHGETTAINAVIKLYKAYGREILVAALRCIVESGDGNVGLIQPHVVRALCAVIEAEPSWSRDVPTLVRCFNDFDFKDRLLDASALGKERKIGTPAALSQFIMAHVERKFEARAA